MNYNDHSITMFLNKVTLWYMNMVNFKYHGTYHFYIVKLKYYRIVMYWICTNVIVWYKNMVIIDSHLESIINVKIILKNCQNINFF